MLNDGANKKCERAGCEKPAQWLLEDVGPDGECLDACEQHATELLMLAHDGDGHTCETLRKGEPGRVVDGKLRVFHPCECCGEEVHPDPYAGWFGEEDRCGNCCDSSPKRAREVRRMIEAGL